MLQQNIIETKWLYVTCSCEIATGPSVFINISNKNIFLNISVGLVRE